MPNTVEREDRTVERLLRQQAALAAFGTFAFRERDLAKVLMEASRICAEGLDVPFCKICRYRPAESDLLVESGFGWNQGVVGGVVSRADATSPQGRAYTTGEPVIVRDLRTPGDYQPPGFYAEHGIVSTVDVLIKSVDGPPYGVLEIDSPEAKDCDRHDVDFLTGFANVLAEAVATADRTETLRAAVAEMTLLVAAKDLLIAEKDMLAEELQHRVRNNLQLIYAMLTGLLRDAGDGPETDGVRAVANRVITLAEVYEHLLGTGMGRTVEFGSYLASLCAGIPALQDGRDGVRLDCQVGPLTLELDTVTAIGMAVAELVANAYRHAFPDGARGTINVALRPDVLAGEAVVTVGDDGVGFGPGGPSKRHGVGLVRRLLEQVGGTLAVDSTRGTIWTLTFPAAVEQAA